MTRSQNEDSRNISKGSSNNGLSYIYEDDLSIEFFEDERQLEQLHRLIDDIDEDFYDEVIELLNNFL